jgi:predicted transcriptional regulator
MRRSIWEDYGQVVASKHKRGVMLALQNRPMTPTEISKEIGVNVTHVSRSLRELIKKQVVICLTPKRRKGRVYSLTEKGIGIVELLREKDYHSK